MENTFRELTKAGIFCFCLTLLAGTVGFKNGVIFCLFLTGMAFAVWTGIKMNDNGNLVVGLVSLLLVIFATVRTVAAILETKTFWFLEKLF